MLITVLAIIFFMLLPINPLLGIWFAVTCVIIFAIYNSIAWVFSNKQDTQRFSNTSNTTQREKTNTQNNKQKKVNIDEKNDDYTREYNERYVKHIAQQLLREEREMDRDR